MGLGRAARAWGWAGWRGHGAGPGGAGMRLGRAARLTLPVVSPLAGAILLALDQLDIPAADRAAAEARIRENHLLTRIGAVAG
jgi:hypothetical protein